MKKTLVILAAGMGSRFGTGIKQLTPVGPNGELIIDYSLHDALKAGFNKIVFIIRKSIEADFRDVIGNRVEKLCRARGVEVAYAFQALDDAPIAVPEGRVKPWGTGHAVLACRDILSEPFAVINADDYYGVSAFAAASALLEKNEISLVAYMLKNTLSESGGVTRGICTIENGKLVAIDETRNIIKTAFGAEANGKPLDLESTVSMNFWCLPSSFIDILKNGFPKFLADMNNPLKDEYLLPIIIDGLIKDGTAVNVCQNDEKWFGMTYHEDIPMVVESFKQLYTSGIYAEDLFSDL